MKILDMDMDNQHNDAGAQGVQVPQLNVAGPMMAGQMVPNQANWANMNEPRIWRRAGRLYRTPSGRWQRAGRLFTVQ